MAGTSCHDFGRLEKQAVPHLIATRVRVRNTKLSPIEIQVSSLANHALVQKIDEVVSLSCAAAIPQQWLRPAAVEPLKDGNRHLDFRGTTGRKLRCLDFLTEDVGIQ